MMQQSINKFNMSKKSVGGMVTNQPGFIQ